MKIKGEFILTCGGCGKKIIFNDEESDFVTPKTGTSPVQHEMCFDFNCSRCGHDIDVEYIVKEVSGKFDDKSSLVKGGKIEKFYQYS
ncbi:MAG TPA: hypothetical protein VK212_01665 [Lentimicrobium sp.]|nr:hypothetical protein [Lentimicrobium sp.]